MVACTALLLLVCCAAKLQLSETRPQGYGSPESLEIDSFEYDNSFEQSPCMQNRRYKRAYRDRHSRCSFSSRSADTPRTKEDKKKIKVAHHATNTRSDGNRNTLNVGGTIEYYRAENGQLIKKQKPKEVYVSDPKRDANGRLVLGADGNPQYTPRGTKKKPARAGVPVAMAVSNGHLFRTPPPASGNQN